ncbi:DinB family protein [Bhargavaea ullalensis]|uniref:Damage-inducible protein DinB n=1 Tax=Bhargavaea ullalensis TaxID=1265685 RepID=A0ABV2GDF2_9BACL
MRVNDEARTELLEVVARLSDEDLNRKPSNGGWSIKQIMEHLYLMEGAVAKTIADQAVNGEETAAEMRPIEATVNRSVKVEAPAFTMPSDQFSSKEELKQKLSSTRSMLSKAEQTSDPQALEDKSYPHPVFGMMKLKQWIPFVGYHEKRHIDQIREVKEDLGF